VIQAAGILLMSRVVWSMMMPATGQPWLTNGRLRVVASSTRPGPDRYDIGAPDTICAVPPDAIRKTKMSTKPNNRNRFMVASFLKTVL
jgi:hypothetical protein